MARYISRSQKFKKAIRKAKQTIVQGPQGPVYQTVVEPMAALFEQGGATPDEIRLALERFQFKGLAEGENPARRISVYDTDEQARRLGWDDDLKAEIEALLDRDQSSDYFKVEAPAAPIPWPSYDQTPPAKILEVALMVGVDPSAVLRYERENKNRTQVVKQLEESLAPQDEVVVEA